MKYSIVFSSHTGNTRLLAETLKSILPESDCVTYGEPDETALNGEFIFIGFWTDKGMCDEAIAEFLKKLHNKKVFIFGTAGFGGSDAYFTQILTRVESLIDTSNELVGHYMCQGKMPQSVRERYVAMLDQNPEKFQSLINNFDQAMTHPDTNDLDMLIKTAFASIH